MQSECNGHHLTFLDDADRHKYILDGEQVPGGSTFTKEGYPMSENLLSWNVRKACEYGVSAAWDAGALGTKKTKKAMNEIVAAAKKVPKQLATAAASIGTIVHDFAYWHEKGDLARALATQTAAENHPDIVKINHGIELFLEWKDKNRDEMIASEEIVALPCNHHGEDIGEHQLCHCYAGKFDRLVRRGGRLILSDFKTSSGIRVEQFLQEGAYAPAIEYWMREKLGGELIGGFEILRFGKEDAEFETMLITDPDEIKAIVRQALVCRMTYAFRRKWEMDKRFKFIGKVAK
jgi:hypothetical protein